MFLPIEMDADLVIVAVDFRVPVHILKFCVSTFKNGNVYHESTNRSSIDSLFCSPLN